MYVGYSFNTLNILSILQKTIIKIYSPSKLFQQQSVMKNANQSGGIRHETDLLRLISLLRERESSLVILFEQKQERQWDRPSWLLKQCEYSQKQSRLSREIRSIILRWALQQPLQVQHDPKSSRSFWIKAKMVIKMSLQRMKLLNLLSFSLFEKYDAIIEAMNLAYDRAAGISYYREIEQMIRNRNRHIHDQLSNCRPYSATLRQPPPFQCPSDPKLREIPFLQNQRITDFSRPRTQKHRKRQTKGTISQAKIKKIHKLVGDYEQKIADVMQAHIDFNIDKKKPLQHNIETLRGQFLLKNIQNAKIISKFILSHGNNILKLKPKLKGRKQGKSNRNKSARPIKQRSNKLLSNRVGKMFFR